MTTPQRLLGQLMSSISEDRTCDGWHIDLEFGLWASLNNDQQAPRGDYSLTKEESDDLLWLISETNGWIVLDDNTKDRKFVPTNEWKPIYEAWRTRQIAAKKALEDQQANCNHQWWCGPLNLSFAEEHCKLCYIDRNEYEGRRIKPLEAHEPPSVQETFDAALNNFGYGETLRKRGE